VAVAMVCVAARITAAEVNARQTNVAKGQVLLPLCGTSKWRIMSSVTLRAVESKDINSERLE